MGKTAQGLTQMPVSGLQNKDHVSAVFPGLNTVQESGLPASGLLQGMDHGKWGPGCLTSIHIIQKKNVTVQITSTLQATHVIRLLAQVLGTNSRFLNGQ
ncbi:hypothetical protein GDO81_013714 [Engystomops pustulosus]|uniref:Uncharacterized protein n=1 Tax=Engystomops pustulosus TaxID=76066 RepID=A0AAV7B520_ENGPU|nr:hypothetical protein GDO81_013714 [Engystomops pustulosus]